MAEVILRDRSPLAVVIPSGPRGGTGDPGGNAMAIGTFGAASGLTIPAGFDLVKVSGTTSEGDWGSGREFVYDAAVDAAYVLANLSTAFLDLAGRGFREVDRTVDLEVTVGTAGEFLTLNKALQHLSKFRRSFKPEGASARVRILNDGWTMAEQVIANNGVNLGWIEIVSDQASTPIIRSALTRSSDAISGFAFIETAYAAFMACNRAVLPRIGCVLAMDASGTGTSRHGIFVTKESACLMSPNAGISGAYGLGAYVIYGSSLIAPNTVWTGNGVGLDPFFAGAVRADWDAKSVVLAEANIHDNPGQGVMINGAASCSLRDATITACGSDGLQTGGCSIVHARGLHSTNNGGRGIYASEGSDVRLLGSTITGNTGNGVHVDQNASVNSSTGTTISNNGSYGVRTESLGTFSISTPTIQNNTLGGINAVGGTVYVSAGNISGHPAGKDLQVNGGDIKLSGTITTTSGNTVANNIADSNVSCFNAIRKTGAGSISGRGGASAARGLATVGSGVTSITVNHGIDPSFGLLLQEITLTPNNNLGAAAKFWPSGLTTTQFTINVDVAPGGSGAKFGWVAQRIIS